MLLGILAGGDTKLVFETFIEVGGTAKPNRISNLRNVVMIGEQELSRAMKPDGPHKLAG